MIPLPLTVFGGYLGAGKTTLINKVLSADHGLRILVLVNDFGAINIDAGLLVSADDDTIELANGCVCCTMGADLFQAVGKALDRRPRPDHMIIEASGVADPVRIANVAHAEPDLTYAGIVTVVDGVQFDELCNDPMIGAQYQAQIACANIIAVSKAEMTEPLENAVMMLNLKALVTTTQALNVEQVLLPEVEGISAEQPPHAAYTKWAYFGSAQLEQHDLAALLKSRPPALYRIKGRVRGVGKGHLVQVVGPQISISSIAQPDNSELVGIGLAALLTVRECEGWWATGLAKHRYEGGV